MLIYRYNALTNPHLQNNFKTSLHFAASVGTNPDDEAHKRASAANPTNTHSNIHGDSAPKTLNNATLPPPGDAVDKSPHLAYWLVTSNPNFVNLKKLNNVWRRLGLFATRRAVELRPSFFADNIMIQGLTIGGSPTLGSISNAYIEQFSLVNPYSHIRIPGIDYKNIEAVKAAHPKITAKDLKIFNSAQAQEGYLGLLSSLPNDEATMKNDRRITQDEHRYIKAWLSTASTKDIPDSINYVPKLARLHNEILKPFQAEDQELRLTQIQNLFDTLSQGLKHSPMAVLRSIPVVKAIFVQINAGGKQLASQDLEQLVAEQINTFNDGLRGLMINGRSRVDTIAVKKMGFEAKKNHLLKKWRERAVKHNASQQPLQKPPQRTLLQTIIHFIPAAIPTFTLSLLKPKPPKTIKETPVSYQPPLKEQNTRIKLIHREKQLRKYLRRTNLALGALAGMFVNRGPI